MSAELPDQSNRQTNAEIINCCNLAQCIKNQKCYYIILYYIILYYTRSLGALRAPTSSLRPFGPPWLRPSRPSGAQAVWPTKMCPWCRCPWSIYPWCDACIHDEGIHDACIHDACIHDTCIHDACIHDACIHDACMYDACICDAYIYDACIYDACNKLGQRESWFLGVGFDKYEMEII